MRIQFTTLLCCTLVSLLFVPALADTGVPVVHSLEQGVIDYRRSNQFERGRVTLLLTVYRSSGPREEFEYRISFDGESIRFDWRGRTVGTPSWGAWHKHIVTSKHYIRDYPGGTVVHIGANSEYTNVRRNYHIFHPRCLGTNLGGTSELAACGLHDLVGRADRSQLTAEKTALRGEPAWKIIYVLASSSIKPTRTVWIRPAHGFAIQRAESIARRGTKTLVWEMDADYRKWGQTWFPKSIDCRYIRLGKLERRETIVVQSAEFGVPIDASVFRMEGLGLKDGRGVSDTRSHDGHSYMWKNGKLKQLPPQAENYRTETPRESNRSTWYVVASFGLAGIACALLVFYLWKRNSRNTS